MPEGIVQGTVQGTVKDIILVVICLEGTCGYGGGRASILLALFEAIHQISKPIKKVLVLVDGLCFV